MKHYFPFLDWMSNYKRVDLGGDLSAGITVGVMLIPQGMAYAMLAGLPPIYGLYAATIPLFIYALLGKTPQFSNPHDFAIRPGRKTRQTLYRGRVGEPYGSLTLPE